MIHTCPCCGGTEFQQTDILWDGLIKEWKLTSEEVAHINRQQGYSCIACGSNLRSMTLAQAIMSVAGFSGILDKFVNKSKLRLLEINEAGHLNKFLKKMKHHTLAEYPGYNIMNLSIEDGQYDLVVHSDTLEHISDPVKALRETHRILKPGGYTCYTIPLMVGRMSKLRPRSQASFHGSPGNDEYLVHTEYGADMWTQLFEAGFSECRLLSLDYPASVAIVARKAS